MQKEPHHRQDLPPAPRRFPALFPTPLPATFWVSQLLYWLEGHCDSKLRLLLCDNSVAGSATAVTMYAGLGFHGVPQKWHVGGAITCMLRCMDNGVKFLNDNLSLPLQF